MRAYDFCPICGAPGVERERRPDGFDTCDMGHRYPSRSRLLLLPSSRCYPETLATFAVAIGTVLRLDGHPNGRWECSLLCTSVVSQVDAVAGAGGVVQGQGKTAQDAMQACARLIVGTRICVATLGRRKEFDVPLGLSAGTL